MMDNYFNFIPHVYRSRQLDVRMRNQLIDSLIYLAESLTPFDPASGEKLELIVRQGIKGYSFSPSSFGLYYEIASSMMNNDFSKAEKLIDELTEECAKPPIDFEVLTLAELPNNSCERYQRLMDMDPESRFAIISPLEASAEAQVQNFNSAFQKLKIALPELAGEVESLIRQVILVEGDPTLGYDFAGGSCYMLWGALFINAASHPTELLMMEAIAHESAHSLLFGFTVDEPLVLNEASERYKSPLRDDPRPMDGIYHSTYVSARMHWAMKQLSCSSAVDDQMAMDALERTSIHALNFHNGLALIKQHGVLSPTGRALMDSAEIYMPKR